MLGKISSLVEVKRLGTRIKEGAWYYQNVNDMSAKAALTAPHHPKRPGGSKVHRDVYSTPKWDSEDSGIYTQMWYRLCHPRFHVSHPDAPGTLRKVRQIHDKTIDLDQWEKVPYPSPLPNYFDFVYSIDQDAGVLALSKWSRVDDTKAPLTLEADLEDVCDDPQVIINLWKSTPEVLSPRIRIVESQDEQCVSSEYPHSVKPLHIGPRFPTALMELQQHFFLDFVFLWRWWIDDPYTWHYGSHVFNAFISAILRIASWDLEVSKNPDVPLPCLRWEMFLCQEWNSQYHAVAIEPDWRNQAYGAGDAFYGTIEIALGSTLYPQMVHIHVMPVQQRTRSPEFSVPVESTHSMAELVAGRVLTILMDLSGYCECELPNLRTCDQNFVS
ncbi:unnamed protein product [Penicillium bialowiezense]